MRSPAGVYWSLVYNAGIDVSMTPFDYVGWNNGLIQNVQKGIVSKHRIDESVRDWQAGKLQRLRARRSNQAVVNSLEALRRALELEPRPSRGSLTAANTMPYLLDCVRAYATLGEICDAMRAVLGTYQEVSIS